MTSIENPADSKAQDRESLGELAWAFFLLGATGFGGPAVHLALMEDEFTRRRRWLSREEFLRLVAAVNLLPGPNSTEMAMKLGYLRHGYRGLFAAGLAFITPAVVSVFFLAFLYTEFATMPDARAVVTAIHPVAVGLVAAALLRFSRTALCTFRPAATAIICGLLSASGVHELACLAVAAVLGAWPDRPRSGGGTPALLLAVLTAPVMQAAPVAVAPALAGIFLFFLRTGSLLFGSGYVLFAFLENGLVERTGWLTRPQLLDAVAAGQITPGPLFSTATFVGYLLAGPSGALVATAGIFLPAFLLVALASPLLPRLEKSAIFRSLLSSVAAGSLGLMFVTLTSLAQAAITGWAAATLSVVSALLLLRTRLNPSLVLLGGSLLGWLAGV